MAVQTGVFTQSSLLKWVRSEDWLTLLLVTTSMVVVVQSVEAAKWVVTPSLSLAAVLGAFTGLAVVRIPWKGWQWHVLAFGVGALAIYIQLTALTEATTMAASMSEINSRLAAWWTALVKSDISVDTLPFAFILSIFAWLGGYLASWTIFKRGNVWPSVLPAAIGLLINLTYLPERYYVYVFPFLLATMMLMVRVHSVQQVIHLERQGIKHPASLRVVWLVAGLILSSLIVGGVSLLPPTHARHQTLLGVWNSSRQPVQWFQEEFGRLFSAVGAKDVALAKRFGPTLPILPVRPTGQEPVFSGFISYPAYWKVRTYNVYSSAGWSTSDTIMEPVPTSPPVLDDFDEAGLSSIAYQVEVASPTRYMYVPDPNLIWVSISAQIELPKTASWLSNLTTLRPKKVLQPGDVYYGGFQLPFYSERVLRYNSQDYPQWARELYLELPSSLPERVKEMAIRLTQDTTNPYDMASAIEKHLRSYKYGTPDSVPRFNQDRVDHFLFESKLGHSDHFASAMTVLLRAAGVPARLASGYGPGEIEEGGTTFTIKESDQHSWTEAYIPSVGWVEFEPSPIYPLRPRQTSDILDFNAGLLEANLEDGLPQEPPDQDTDEEEEIDPGGGRLPGGLGLRPFPLILRVSPMSANGLLLIGLMAVWAASLWWGWRRFFLRLPHPELAYARMYRMTALLAVETKMSHTPMEFGGALAAAIPETREDIRLICEAFCKARYGGAKPSARERRQLGLAWDHVRKAMIRYSLS